jgi:hypothetical protein
VCVCLFINLFSMLHYMVILHALKLNIHNMVTYSYQLCTISSTFCRLDTASSDFLCIAHSFSSSIYCIIYLPAYELNLLSYGMNIFDE